MSAADSTITLEGLTFRDVHDGDAMPAQEAAEPNEEWRIRLLMWFCPSLTEEEARALFRLPESRSLAMSVSGLRAYILRHLPAIRAKAGS